VCYDCLFFLVWLLYKQSSGFRFGKIKLHRVRSIEHVALGGFAVIVVMVLGFETVLVHDFV
jgi:hypothetical protein